MEVESELERARAAHERNDWADACATFAAVDQVRPLAVEDLERLAEAAQILGRGDEAIALLQRLYQARVDAGDIGAALRCAFWLYQAFGMNSEFAQAGGWIARAGRLGEPHPECPEHGYLLIAEAERRDGEGDHRAAASAAARAAELGARGGDADLVTAGTHVQARALINQGQVDEGLSLLDEAMLNITSGETSPRISGWIYCSTIAACHHLHEVRRAREWTTALNAWCDSAPQFTGAYSGICRIHRSELLQLGGDWPDAVREAKVACERLTQGFGQLVAGAAFYQLGEIHRLRGEAADADEAYRAASQSGWRTEPGWALLRLGQGKTAAAAAAIRRALVETTDRLARSQLLPGFVEIMLAADDLDAAREGAAELAEVADSVITPALQARATHARGAVKLAEGAADTALPPLRQAWRLWRDLDAPYEAARVRVLVGQACRALQDEDSAAMEFDAARRVFAQLGARPDVDRVDTFAGKRLDDGTFGLSPRELEVLRLVAAGKTNHAIATDLFLSDKTVHRHVSNIFTKLGVTSRTAAATYAFEHNLTR